MKEKFKTEIIEKQYFIIDDLSLINDLNVKVQLFQNDKVFSKWNNVFDYYDSLEEPNIDATLIDFFDTEDNFKSLSKVKLNYDTDKSEK